MRVTVLGASGAWPTAEQACSGFLVEYGDFRLVLDLGYATLPRLMRFVRPDQVDAVVISHGHPDHCADLNPLLRARALPAATPPLPVYALPHALDAVLALDNPRMLAGSYALYDLTEHSGIGPFEVRTALLPHFVPNAGVRLSAGRCVFAYTGDTGPSPRVAELAREADLLLAEATFVTEVPESDAGFLTSAVDAGRQAAEAGVARLVLTHLWPGTDPEQAGHAAAASFGGPVQVAGHAGAEVLHLP